MSDDDEIPYVKKPRTIHYGSLEDGEKARLEAGNEDNGEDATAKDATQSAPQIHISNGNTMNCEFLM